MKKIKFGIIGTNWITDSFIESGKNLPDFALNAVYSRSEERAKEFAQKHQVSNTFTNIEAMAKSDTIDAVYIASPNSWHSSQASMFLRYKKHVLCEKPLATNLHEVESMIQAAQKNKVLLMEAMKTTFMPNYLEVKKNLYKIGKIRKYIGNYCQYSSQYEAFKEGKRLPNIFNPEFGTGSLMDIGIYPLYVCIDLFGMPKQIKSISNILPSKIDGSTTLLLKYNDDIEATVFSSKITNSFIPSEIQGEKGTIVIRKISNVEGVKIHYNDGTEEDISVKHQNTKLLYEVKHFIEMLQQKKIESSINTFQLSKNVMQIIDEARQQVGVKFKSDDR